MNAELILPVVRECLQRLREDGVSPEDLVRHHSEHHFFGFGLWFRNRFCYAPDAPLKHFSLNADSVSSLFTGMVIEHWECSEDEWRIVLTQTNDSDPFSSPEPTSRLVISPDDEL